MECCRSYNDRKKILFLLFIKKEKESLLSFNFYLPEVDKYHTDGNFVYSNIYGKKVSQEKSKWTNLVENLNSQMRDKIFYLVRKSKACAKSFKWLDYSYFIFL